MVTTRSSQLRDLIQKDLGLSSADIQAVAKAESEVLTKELADVNGLTDSHDYKGSAEKLMNLGKRLEEASKIYEKESGADLTPVHKAAQDIYTTATRLMAQIKLGGPAEVKGVLAELSSDMERALKVFASA